MARRVVLTKTRCCAVLCHSSRLGKVGSLIAYPSNPLLFGMEISTLASPTVERSDVFSISDQALSDRLQFIQEVNDTAAYLCTDLGERA